MAGSQSIGNANINLKPKMDGSFESDVKSGVQGAAESGGSFFGNTFTVAAGNLLSEGIKKVATAAADTFRQGFEGYANYEQLIGGVETLFKDSAGVVQANASKAFETAGMSANEYMENVTNFSASLLQGLGGDTQKAAAYADMAVRDMSDNANKFGTDMGRITDAYQGFSKQNYTMLDNLKLGYGGTKSEMERLLADASKIAGIDFNIENFNDVVEAIHVMQENMGIAGTTAQEAEHTISGSIGMLKASWSNFLTGMFDDNADIGALGEQLMHSLGAVLQNVAPRIAALVGNLVMELPGAITAALSAIPPLLQETIVSVFGETVGGQINEVLGGALSGVGESFSSLFSAFGETLTNLWTTIQPVVQMIGDIFAAVMPVIMTAIQTVTDFIANNVLPMVNEVLDVVRPVIEQIASDIGAKMPEIQSIMDDVMSAIRDLINAVWPVISTVVITAVKAISEVIKVAWPIISAIIDTAMGVIKGIIETVWPVIQGIVETVMGAIQGIVETVWPIISGIVETAAGVIKGAIEGIGAVVSTVQSIFDGIKHAIEDPMGTAQDIVRGAIDAIRGFFDFHIEWPHIPLPHFSVSGSANPLDWLEGGLPSFSIDWYAKGGFVDGATLIGAGEAGPEMILPRQGALMDDFASRVASRVGGGVDIHDCTFVVRKDDDIRRVAEELDRLINRQTAGGFA